MGINSGKKAYFTVGYPEQSHIMILNKNIEFQINLFAQILCNNFKHTTHSVYVYNFIEDFGPFVVCRKILSYFILLSFNTFLSLKFRIYIYNNLNILHIINDDYKKY